MEITIRIKEKLDGGRAETIGKLCWGEHLRNRWRCRVKETPGGMVPEKDQEW